jgi:hypothetical protein
MDIIIELVGVYDLTQWSTIRNDRGNSYQYMDKLGINIIFNDWDNSFEFKWIIPNSIFNISCPNCSPYTNREHFDRMYQKFRLTVLTYSSTYNEL